MKVSFPENRCMVVQAQLDYLFRWLENIESGGGEAPDLTELKAEMAKLQQQMTNLEKKVGDFDYAAIQKQLDGIAKQLQTIEAEQSNQNSRLDSAENHAKTYEALVNNLTQSVTSQGQEINSLKAKDSAQDAEIAKKQDKLTAGTNITIVDNVISATGGGGEAGDIDGDVTPDSGNAVASSGIYKYGQGIKTELEGDIEQVKQTAESKQDKLTFDAKPTINSKNPVESGGVYYDLLQVQGDIANAEADILELQDKDKEIDKQISDIKSSAGTSDAKINELEGDLGSVKSDVQSVQNSLANKQDKLIAGQNITIQGNVISAAGGDTPVILDDEVTESSENGVKSSGIYDYGEEIRSDLNGHIEAVEQDVENNTNDISQLKTQVEDNTNNLIKYNDTAAEEYEKIAENQQNIQNLQSAINGKQDTLTFDNTPTAGSSNPVKSSGIASAIQTVQDSANEAKTDASDAKMTAEQAQQTAQTAVQTAAGKQDKLEAGENIKIEGNVISSTGGGSEYTAGDGILITEGVISAKPTSMTSNPSSTTEFPSVSVFNELGRLTNNMISHINYKTSSTNENYPLQTVNHLQNSGGYNSTAGGITFGYRDVYVIYSDTYYENTIYSKALATNAYVTQAISKIPKPEVNLDDSVTQDSENGVKSSGIYQYGQNIQNGMEAYVGSALSGKQDKLTAGAGISISGNVISATGGSSGGSGHYVNIQDYKTQSNTWAQALELASADSSYIYFPIGSYNFSGTTVKVPRYQSIHLLGEYTTLSTSSGQGQYHTVINNLIVKGDDSGAASILEVENIYFQNFAFGNNDNAGSFSNVIIRNCNIRITSTSYVSYAVSLDISNSYLYHSINDFTMIKMFGSRNFWNISDTTLQAGSYESSAVLGELTSTSHVTFTNCLFQYGSYNVGTYATAFVSFNNCITSTVGLSGACQITAMCTQFSSEPTFNNAKYISCIGVTNSI